MDIANENDSAKQIAGIKFESLYNKEDELVLMAKMAEAAHIELRPEIVSISCDSKAEWDFTVSIRADNESLARYFASVMSDVLVEDIDGYNSLRIIFAENSKTLFHVDEYWAWQN